jgi:hypothetical protein
MHLYYITPSHLTVMAAIAVAVLMAVKVCVRLVYLSLQEDTRVKCKVITAVLMQIQVFWNMSSRMTDIDPSEVSYKILLSIPYALSCSGMDKMVRPILVFPFTQFFLVCYLTMSVSKVIYHR